MQPIRNLYAFVLYMLSQVLYEIGTAQKMKSSIKDFSSKSKSPLNPRNFGLVTFTGEILNGKLFLYSEDSKILW